jgi:hypothetical protein
MFKKLLQIITAIITNPKRLLQVVNPDENESRSSVLAKYKLPDGLPIVPLTHFLISAPYTVSPYLYLEGGSLPTDLLLLSQLAQKPTVDTYFEIGTWRGESVLNVAPYVKESFTLNLSNEEMERRGATLPYISQSGMLLKSQPYPITQLYGNSQTFDFSPWYGTCDLVFVDGDHHYQSVVHDTKEAFKLLKNEESILVWHDYGHSPEVIRWELLLAIADACPNGFVQHLYHVGNTKCAVFSKTSLPATTQSRPLVPNQSFTLTLEVNEL